MTGNSLRRWDSVSGEVTDRVEYVFQVDIFSTPRPGQLPDKVRLEKLSTRYIRQCLASSNIPLNNMDSPLIRLQRSDDGFLVSNLHDVCQRGSVCHSLPITAGKAAIPENKGQAQVSLSWRLISFSIWSLVWTDSMDFSGPRVAEALGCAAKVFIM
jgi:hypothetical protein